MPNVVLFMSDEHNPFISSVYGHPFVRTPNMERLARAGTVFENAYCPSPLSGPSRAAFMAGKPVHRVRMYNNCRVIQHNHPTYGGVLSAQGVHTAYIGVGIKVFCNPDDLGFDELIDVQRSRVSLGTEFARTPVPSGAKRVADTKWGPRPGAWKKSTRYVDQAIDWLRNAPTRDWMLAVNIKPPHFPLVAHPDLWAMYERYADTPRYGTNEASAHHPYACDLRAYLRADEVTETQARGMRQGYYAGVTYADRELGRVMDALAETGRLDETMVIYTSDHGEMLGKFGLWRKMSMFEDAVRVPLIVAGPGFAKGLRVESPVGLLDLQAAIFCALGRDRPHDWSGEPLQDVASRDPARTAFSEYHGHGVRSGAFMVRRGDWKFVYNAAAPHQLFNLRDDPNELDNRCEREPELAAAMESELRRICNPDEENFRAHAFERRQLAAIAELLHA